MVRKAVGIRLVLPSESFTAVRSVPDFSFFSVEEEGAEGEVAAGFGIGAEERPLWTHSAIAVMLKLAAMSMALGR